MVANVKIIRAKSRTSMLVQASPPPACAIRRFSSGHAAKPKVRRHRETFPIRAASDDMNCSRHVPSLWALPFDAGERIVVVDALVVPRVDSEPEHSRISHQLDRDVPDHVLYEDGVV